MTILFTLDVVVQIQFALNGARSAEAMLSNSLNDSVGNMSREERLLAFIYEVSTEVMEIDSNSSEVIPQDQPSTILRKLSRKVGKADSYAIYCYYEFGLAVINRLNELIEQGQKRARNKLNTEIQRYLPAGTSLAVAKDKIKKARKMVDILVL